MEKRRKNNILELFVLSLFLMPVAFGQVNVMKSAQSVKKDQNQASKQQTPKKRVQLQNFFKDKTKLKDPFSLRDPFKPPTRLAQKSSKKKASVYKGVFTNLPTIDNLTMEDIKVTGVLIGKERRAMAKVGENVVILKEGMKIGDDDAVIKAILPGGIVLVEKITNVYGQVEYLETVIPISTAPLGAN